MQLLEVFDLFVWRVAHVKLHDVAEHDLGLAEEVVALGTALEVVAEQLHAGVDEPVLVLCRDKSVVEDAHDFVDPESLECVCSLHHS